MKIKSTYEWEAPKDETVTQYAERSLAGFCCGSGQIETIDQRAINNSRAIGRLLEVLASKGLLTAPEVTRIVNRFENEDAQFIQ